MKVMSETLELDVAQRVRDAFAKNPTAMTVQLARELNLPERDVVAALPEGRSRALDVTRWQEVLKAMAVAPQVHVIVSSSGCTLESIGQLGNFSTWGDYFNVQSKSIDMHIRGSQIGSVFVVSKQSHMDGVETLSVQFFTHAGQAAFKVFLTFGKKPPTEETKALVEDLVKRFGAA
jgi:putative heme utilization carrier protein HutX